jgi:hypothetical protein
VGRVIVSAEVKSSRTDEETKETAVVLELVFVGDEIPETTLTIRRRVRAVDPDDLGSPMVYSVEVLENGITTTREDDGLKPSERRVLKVLKGAASGEWLDKYAIGDRLAVDDTGLACLMARTIQNASKVLVENGLIESRESAGSAYQWRAISESEEAEIDL